MAVGSVAAAAAGAAAAPTLSASGALMTAAMALQNADVTPTADQVANATKSRTGANTVMAKWTRLKDDRIMPLNDRRRVGGNHAEVATTSLSRAKLTR